MDLKIQTHSFPFPMGGYLETNALTDNPPPPMGRYLGYLFALSETVSPVDYWRPTK